MKQTVALGGQRIHRRKTREGLASAILVLCIALLAGSCSNNGTGPAPTNGPYPLPNFQLTINVKDAVRRPVSSLRVCGGSLVNVAAQNQSSLNWGRLLVARLTAEDTLQARVLFRDSVYLVCAPFDNGNPQGELGYTSTSGSLEIDNVDRFAGLLQLPAQYLTGPTGPDTLGSFGFLSAARLVLYDTVSHASQQYDVALTVGSNTVDLTWQAERMSTQGSNRNPDWWRLGRPSDVIPVPPVDTSWGLFQNFPNPFDSTTTFQFVLARPARVSLEIATLSGDKIDEVMGDHLMPAGTFRLLYAPGTFLGANAVR